MDNLNLNIVGLIGNPNCGKSTLFNRLTGLKQKTSNLPGTTVEIFTGQWGITNTDSVKLMDFPGSYSLCSTNNEEERVVKVLMGEGGQPKPSAIIYVLSAVNLRRGLLLFQQCADLGYPMIVALTMTDTAQIKKIEVDTSKLSELLGLPVVKVNARTGEGSDQLNLAIRSAKPSTFQHQPETFENDLKCLIAGKPIPELHKNNLDRYIGIEKIVKQTVVNHDNTSKSFTRKLDSWITHPVLGFVIFGLVMLTIFQGVFSLAEFPMQWIESGFGWISEQLQILLPDNALANLLTKGLIPGIMGVVTFLPQIAILFFFIGILEDSGYMARASFISDSLMRKIGLNGRSVIPLVGGFACAIPSIMACRTIKNPVERLATMFIIPLMSCSARLPVYLLLVSLIVPKTEFLFHVNFGEKSVGILQIQALWMTGAYFAGIVVAIFVAFLLKIVRKRGNNSEFLLEMPTYQIPLLSSVVKQVILRCKSFLNEAGKIIIILSMVLWFLSAYGPSNKMKEAAETAKEISIKKHLSPEETSALVSEYKLQNSYIGVFGQWIEPALKPMGFDWKTGIAIASSFAAREVFVGTMGTLFSTNSSENEVTSIRDKMAQVKDPATGKLVYSKKYAISLMFFFAFALQCVSTIAVMKRETGGWKWPMIQLFGYTALAIISSLVINNFF